MEDDMIVQLYWDRDETAVAESAKKYGAYCTSIARNILFSLPDAEECVNETWLRAWKSMPPHRPHILSTFLGKITRRLSLKKCRNSSADKRGGGTAALSIDELEECIPSSVNVETAYEAKEISSSISRFLDTLPYEDRYCFIRRYWYADPVSDIAAQVHRDSHRISVRLFRTREKLNRYLREEGLLE